MKYKLKIFIIENKKRENVCGYNFSNTYCLKNLIFFHIKMKYVFQLNLKHILLWNGEITHTYIFLHKTKPKSLDILKMIYNLDC